MIDGVTKFSLQQKKIRNGSQQIDNRQGPMTVYAVRPFWGNYETFLARVLLVDNTNYI